MEVGDILGETTVVRWSEFAESQLKVISVRTQFCNLNIIYSETIEEARFHLPST